MLENRKQKIDFKGRGVGRNLFAMSAILVLILWFISCDSENASDCFQETGDIMREEVLVAEFTSITVFENVALVIKQGDTQKVEIETGENLRNEVAAIVEDGRLLLTDTNNCNYVRDYGTTVVSASGSVKLSDSRLKLSKVSTPSL